MYTRRVGSIYRKKVVLTRVVSRNPLLLSYPSILMSIFHDKPENFDYVDGGHVLGFALAVHI